MQCRGLSARPLHPFGSPPEAIGRLIGLQALLPRRSRRVKPHQRGISYGKVVFYRCNAGGFPLAPCTPSDRSRRENTGGFPRGKQSARQAPPKRNSLGRGFALRSEHVLPAVHSPSPKNDRHVPKHAGRFSLAASVSPVAHRRMALYFSAQTACTFSMAFCTSSSVRVRSAARKVREKATLFLPSPT